MPRPANSADIDAIQEHGQCRGVHLHVVCARRQPGRVETATLEALVVNGKTASFPKKHFAAVTAFAEKNEEMTGEKILLPLMTNDRAQAIAARISALGVSADRLKASGLGASLPVAPNTTAANRAKNRRVQIIFAPNVN